MDAWEALPPHEYDRAWGLFTATFRFRPSIHAADWPSVVEPLGSVTYDVSDAYAHDDPWLRPVRAAVNQHVLGLFRTMLPPDGWAYAMDWHQGWRLRPHVEFDAADVRAWGVDVLPHAEYTVLVTPDLRDGLFGHPWEGTICAFGDRLVPLLAADPPALFAKVARRDGVKVAAPTT